MTVELDMDLDEIRPSVIYLHLPMPYFLFCFTSTLRFSRKSVDSNSIKRFIVRPGLFSNHSDEGPDGFKTLPIRR